MALMGGGLPRPPQVQRLGPLSPSPATVAHEASSRLAAFLHDPPNRDFGGEGREDGGGNSPARFGASPATPRGGAIRTAAYSSQAALERQLQHSQALLAGTSSPRRGSLSPGRMTPRGGSGGVGSLRERYYSAVLKTPRRPEDPRDGR